MTNLPPRQTRYFVAGGAMRPNVPSYVERPADGELHERISAGDFCYVLTPRQMGKSSLMVRSSRRLKEQGTHTVIIDLTEIGSVSIDKWYQGLLTKLQRDLKLSIDIKSWWQEHDNLGQPQRFFQFLTDVVLSNVLGNIVIFVDEIDSTLNLDFRDDFFATIRALYNGRSHNPELERITFVLLGVASPSELIEDRLRTPFNIGSEINLKEFDRQDAHVLVEGLSTVYPEQGEEIFDRIYYWTNGHPYLTQQLCVHITNNETQYWDDAEIDSLVDRLFLRDEARGETNIQFVSDRILKSPRRPDLLKLYKQVYQGKDISDNKQSPIQSQLLLSGLVKIEDGHLTISNQIYRQAFGRDWIKKETAINWILLIGGVALILAILAIIVLVREAVILPNSERNSINDFYTAEEAPTRTAALVKMLKINPWIGSNSAYESQARDLFYDRLLNWKDQSDILEPGHFRNPEEFARLVRAIYIVLADVDNDGDSTRLLQKMNGHLLNWSSKNERTVELHDEIRVWLEAREELNTENYDNAQRMYIKAIQTNPNNPATRFELARAYIFLATTKDTEKNYDLALRQLDKVVEMTSLLDSDPVPEVTPSRTLSPTIQLVVVTTSSIAPDADLAPVPTTPQSPSGEPMDAPDPVQQPDTTVLSSPTLNPNSVIPKFISIRERREAVEILLKTYPDLLLFAQKADETSYLSLRRNDFITKSLILPLTADLGDYWLRPIDDMAMVFVPEGSFPMGSQEGQANEMPVHGVNLDAFWIDRTVVTNAQFTEFVNTTGYETTAEEQRSSFVYTNGEWIGMTGVDWRHPQSLESDLNNLEDYPVVHISWYDAEAYCEWVDGRLPSEAEWEYAARSPEGLTYPWGDSFDGEKANSCDINCTAGWANETVDDGYEFIAPTGTYPEGGSWTGALDMGGNVLEWVNEWYDADYYSKSPANNPQGPDSGNSKVLRGGSWHHGESGLRSPQRYDANPNYRSTDIGFRCLGSPGTDSNTLQVLRITPTPSPQLATTILAPSTDELPVSVRITDILLDDGSYIVSYETTGYTEQLLGRHIHFYFDTVSETNAGIPGSGSWILYGGPRPFTEYTESDRPAAATAMCTIVSNTDHSIIPGTGNCFPLPQSVAPRQPTPTP